MSLGCLPFVLCSPRNVLSVHFQVHPYSNLILVELLKTETAGCAPMMSAMQSRSAVASRSGSKGTGTAYPAEELIVVSEREIERALGLVKSSGNCVCIWRVSACGSEGDNGCGVGSMMAALYIHSVTLSCDSRGYLTVALNKGEQSCLYGVSFRWQNRHLAVTYCALENRPRTLTKSQRATHSV
jgi:hypothetical protein